MGTFWLAAFRVILMALRVFWMVSEASIGTYLITEKNLNEKYFFIMKKNMFKHLRKNRTSKIFTHKNRENVSFFLDHFSRNRYFLKILYFRFFITVLKTIFLEAQEESHVAKWSLVHCYTSSKYRKFDSMKKIHHGENWF